MNPPLGYVNREFSPVARVGTLYQGSKATWAVFQTGAPDDCQKPELMSVGR